MNIKVLTDEQIIRILEENRPEHDGPNKAIAVSRAIEQAVLQSPEVQALIIAAQEFNGLYGWLWDTTDGGGFLSPDGVKRYDAAHHKLRVALCSMTGKPLPIELDED